MSLTYVSLLGRLNTTTSSKSIQPV